MEPEPLPRRRILVALDGSEQSNEAFEFALAKVFHRGNDSVILLHVTSTSQSPEGVDDYLEDFKRLAEAKELEAETMSVTGDARQVIISMAEKLGVDLLVLGSHGKGVAKRLLLGSVSDHCAHNAPCPVLVHRSPAKT